MVRKRNISASRSGIFISLDSCTSPWRKPTFMHTWWPEPESPPSERLRAWLLTRDQLSAFKYIHMPPSIAFFNHWIVLPFSIFIGRDPSYHALRKHIILQPSFPWSLSAKAGRVDSYVTWILTMDTQTSFNKSLTFFQVLSLSWTLNEYSKENPW